MTQSFERPNSPLEDTAAVAYQEGLTSTALLGKQPIESAYDGGSELSGQRFILRRIRLIRFDSYNTRNTSTCCGPSIE
jgi:hypothetical protein